MKRIGVDGVLSDASGRLGGDLEVLGTGELR